MQCRQKGAVFGKERRPVPQRKKKQASKQNAVQVRDKPRERAGGGGDIQILQAHPSLQHQALPMLLLRRRRLKSSHNGLKGGGSSISTAFTKKREDGILGRALDVFHGAQLLGHALAVLATHGAHLLLHQLLADAGVVAEIGLGADDEAGDAGAVVVHFGEPLFAHVFEGGGGGDGEADEEDVGLGVGEGAETVVIFLSGGIEEAEG
ncbi:hypothetical protein V494_04780, partial [Pseudogymnoascus sp. VKM F-4513 (FW-928)]